MSQFRRLLFALLLVGVGPVSGCIFLVETGLDGPTTEEEQDEQNQNQHNGTPQEPTVSIVDADDIITVDRGDSPLIQYQFDCQPEGCQNDLECRVEYDGSLSDWAPCTSPFDVDDELVGEGLHRFEVGHGEGEDRVEDAHETVLLYAIDLAISIDGDEPIPHSYDYETDADCDHPECQLTCFWEADDGTFLGPADCSAADQTLSVDFPDDVDAAELVVQACADRELPDGIEHCTSAQRFSFVAGPPTWREISAGSQHSCAIHDDRSLWCWGQNVAGQLGLGYTSDRAATARLVERRNWQQVSAGDNHTCAIDTDGTLYCWGDNSLGQLGFNSEDPDIPREVVDYSEHGPWQRVDAGIRHTCAINDQDQLFCWGANGRGQLGPTPGEAIAFPEDHYAWLDVAVGDRHTCAIAARDEDDTGAAFCWGDQSNGRLGNNEEIDSTEIPQEVRGDFPSFDAQIMAPSEDHSCGVVNDGGLGGGELRTYCWGNGDEGKLGNAGSSMTLTPQRVIRADELFDDYDPQGFDNYFALGTGADHSCGLHEDGTPFCWGDNIRDQLGRPGDASNVPVATEPPEGVQFTDLAVGTNHSCAITDSGAIYCWGRADQAALGLGEDDDGLIEGPVPTEIAWPH